MVTTAIRQTLLATSSIRRRRGLGGVILWALLLVLVGIPITVLFAMSFNAGNGDQVLPDKLGLQNFQLLGSELGGVLWKTVLMAVWVTAISGAIGLVLAWIIARTKIRAKGILTLLIILPFPMGAMVSALAWSALAAPSGGLLNVWLGTIIGDPEAGVINIYSFVGVILVQSFFQTPVAFLLMQSALQGMDASLEEASDILGARKRVTAWRITFPLVLPGIISACLFTFVSALGAFAIPAVIGRSAHVSVVTTEIYRMVKAYPRDYPLASALGVATVLISAAVILLAGRILRHRTHAVVGGKARTGSTVDLGRWQPVASAVVWLYVTIAVLLPIVALTIASLQETSSLDLRHLTWSLTNFRYSILEYPATRTAIQNTLIVGAATAVLGVMFATAAALRVERARRAGRRAKGIEQLSMAPQAVPRLIFTVPLLLLIVNMPVQLYGTLAAIIICYVIVFLPLAYRSMAAVVSQAHPSLEEAARSLGAHRTHVTATITLPLLKLGLVSGAGLLFMVSFSELGASVLLATPNSQVLGPTLYNFLDSGGISLVSSLALVQSLIVIAVLALVRRLGGKVLGA